MLRSLLAALVLSAATAYAEEAKITNTELSLAPAIQTLEIIEMIDVVFYDYSASDRAIIVKIADCESGGKNRLGGPNGLITHLDKKGRVVKNKTSGAAGAMQIYSASHNPVIRAKYDEDQIWDNLLYARELIEGRKRAGQYRFADWTASKPCWTQEVQAPQVA